MRSFEYRAVLARQSNQSQPVVLFFANAIDIETWAGVPQKRELAAGSQYETTGFQRTVSEARLEQLSTFLSDPANIIQNPLLCAIRPGFGGNVEFQSSDVDPEYGNITIHLEDIHLRSIKELLIMMRDQLVSRLPEILAKRDTSLDNLNALRELASGQGLTLSTSEGQEAEATEGENDDSFQNDAEAALTEESHIIDFYDQIQGRIALLEEMDGYDGDEFLGFSREALLSFLKPVIVVDGQHRLMASIRAARDQTGEDPALIDLISKRLDEKIPPEIAQQEAERLAARQLPLSLLLDPRPAEHVFQFVIVNQKATPIGRPLLGTIVATTLSQDELTNVAARLSQAGIPLEDSRAIAMVSRETESPFYSLIQRGLASEASSEVLAWSVAGGLVKTFRELRGGVLYGSRNDYADLWRDQHLASSGVVSAYATAGFDDVYTYWRHMYGPWRDIFYTFFSSIRDIFGNTEDPQAHNYWGSPRTSNLFNKISLSILAADFFQFLFDARKSIESVEGLSGLIDDWLRNVSGNYFARDWKLEGVKKDSGGIRKQWVELWVEYRKNPSRLPRTENYRISKA